MPANAASAILPITYVGVSEMMPLLQSRLEISNQVSGDHRLRATQTPSPGAECEGLALVGEPLIIKLSFNKLS